MASTGKQLQSEFKSDSGKLPKVKDLPKDAVAAGNDLWGWVDARAASLDKWADYDLVGLRKDYDDKLAELRKLKKAHNDAVQKAKVTYSALSDQVGHLRDSCNALLKLLDKSGDKDAAAQAKLVKVFNIKYAQGGYPGLEPAEIPDEKV